MTPKTFWHKHGSAVTFAVSIVGLLSSVATAVLGTVKACKKISDQSATLGRPLTKKEIFKCAWIDYVPCAVSLAATATGMAMTRVHDARRIESLTEAYAVLASSFAEYRQCLDNKMENGDETIRSDVAVLHVPEEYRDLVPNGDAVLFYDEVSRRYFIKTMLEVRDAEYHLNRNFSLRGGEAPLNEFYDFLGIERVPYGDDIGWNIDAGEEFYGYSWIDFSHELATTDDGLEVYIIHMPFPPTLDYSVGGYSADHLNYTEGRLSDQNAGVDVSRMRYKDAAVEARKENEQ